jgi:hypothetical protein
MTSTLSSLPAPLRARGVTVPADRTRIVNEEREHRLYAERDPAALGARAAEDGGR